MTTSGHLQWNQVTNDAVSMLLLELRMLFRSLHMLSEAVLLPQVNLKLSLCNLDLTSSELYALTLFLWSCLELYALNLSTAAARYSPGREKLRLKPKIRWLISWLFARKTVHPSCGRDVSPGVAYMYKANLDYNDYVWDRAKRPLQWRANRLPREWANHRLVLTDLQLSSNLP